MSGNAAETGVRLSERVIPIPKSISPEAQAFFEFTAQQPVRPQNYPALSDKPGWHIFVDAFNMQMEQMFAPATARLPASVSLETMAGVPVYLATPNEMPEANRDKAILYCHGGGLVLMGGACVKHFALMEAAAQRCTVFAVDYRNPPDHPYPAALDDCVAVYREAIKRFSPKNVAIAGASGGGNLATAVTLKLRDAGLPMPAAVALMTPEVDLTETGDTFNTNRDIDVILRGPLPELTALYANGHDLAHPYLSPIFGDFAKGYPPTFIQTGTRDVYLSNSARMHRALLKAGIDAELHVWEAMPHGGFGGMTPEDGEVKAALARFLAKHWGVRG